MKLDCIVLSMQEIPFYIFASSNVNYLDKLGDRGLAAQVLRQLAAESSYRSLVALGVAGVMGASVAAFRMEDAAHLISLKHLWDDNFIKGDSDGFWPVSSWLIPPVASRKRMRLLPSLNVIDKMLEDGKILSKVNEEGSSNIGKWYAA